MRRFYVSTCLSLALAMFPLSLGCGTSVQQDDSNDRPVTAAASAGSVKTSESTTGALHIDKSKGVPNDVLSAWETGDKDRAVELLLSIPWDEPTRFSDRPLLSMTEQEFSSLSRSERNRHVEEAIKLVSRLKGLARHAIALGDKARSSGDKQRAKVYYEAVLHLGEAISNPDKLLILQQLGRGLVSIANEQLSTLD
jgi:hypothetical protein